MCGKNTSEALSENMLAVPGFSMFTVAAPSKMTASTVDYPYFIIHQVF
jgi:hypothetical protein